MFAVSQFATSQFVGSGFHDIAILAFRGLNAQNVLRVGDLETTDSRIGNDQARYTYSTIFRIPRYTRPPNQGLNQMSWDFLNVRPLIRESAMTK